MRAVELLRRRIVYSETAFAELVLWQLSKPLPGSMHPYKCSVAYGVRNVCVLRYDSEAGKGDHRHFRGRERPYGFVGIEELLSNFQRDIERIQREDRDA